MERPTQDKCSASDLFDLALVMPLYNEEECIAELVGLWRRMLKDTTPNHTIIVLNDGSRDNTASVLKQFSGDPRIQIINKKNSGHGPTIMMGYRRAVQQAEWVFQVDSDNEMQPDAFPNLWQQRPSYDFLFGMRGNRKQNTARKLISLISRLAVGLLFRKGVLDVNTPYRLMRSALLKKLLTRIPNDTFAPNIIISGLCAKNKYRIYNTTVAHFGRKTGSVSIVKWKLWVSAGRALLQTVSAAFRKGTAIL